MSAGDSAPEGPDASGRPQVTGAINGESAAEKAATDAPFGGVEDRDAHTVGKQGDASVKENRESETKEHIGGADEIDRKGREKNQASGEVNGEGEIRTDTGGSGDVVNDAEGRRGNKGDADGKYDVKTDTDSGGEVKRDTDSGGEVKRDTDSGGEVKKDTDSGGEVKGDTDSGGEFKQDTDGIGEIKEDADRKGGVQGDTASGSKVKGETDGRGGEPSGNAQSDKRSDNEQIKAGGDGSGGIGGDGASETGSADSSRSGGHPVVFAYTPPKPERMHEARSGGVGKQKLPGVARARASISVGKSASISDGQQKPQQPPPLQPKRGPEAGRQSGVAANASVDNKDGRVSRTAAAPARRSQQKIGSSPEAKRQVGNSSSKVGGSEHDDRGSSARRRPQSEHASDDEGNIYKDQLRQAKAELERAKEAVAMRQHEKPRARSARGYRQIVECSGSYCDTQVLNFYIRKDTSRQYYPASKQTATTLVDPWEDLAQQRPAERVRRPKSRKSLHQPPHQPLHQPQHQPQNPDAAGAGPASSCGRCTPRALPIVDFGATAEYWRRPVWFGELPKIRASIREARAATGSRRRQADYARAADECRSLELDGLDRLRGRQSRRNLARCCSAYLSSTPGSRAALDDCLERVRSRTGRRWDSPSEDGATEPDEGSQSWRRRPQSRKSHKSAVGSEA